MEPRPLTSSEINALASRVGVRRIAVENFLGSIDLGLTYMHQVANLNMDGRLYGWTTATRNAIATGIKVAYGRGKIRPTRSA